LRFLRRRIWVSLFELRHTPYRVIAEGQDSEYPPIIAAAMLLWMGFARLMFLALLIFLVRDLWGGRLQRSLWALALTGAAWAPYVLVFAYQRHVVPLLVMAGFVLVTLYFGEPRFGRGKPILARPAPSTNVPGSGAPARGHQTENLMGSGRGSDAQDQALRVPADQGFRRKTNGSTALRTPRNAISTILRAADLQAFQARIP